MNEIRISFDQQQAVRIRDGLQLEASMCDPELNRCAWCVVPQSGTSCSVSAADNPRIRCCNAAGRKDRRDIIWRPA